MPRRSSLVISAAAIRCGSGPSKDRVVANTAAYCSIHRIAGTFGLVADSHPEISGTASGLAPPSA